MKESDVTNGAILRFPDDQYRDWIAIHIDNVTVEIEENWLSKDQANYLPFLLFGGPWYEGDPWTSKPYGKCRGQLSKIDLNEIKCVGNVISKDDWYEYKQSERL